jgi:hypothetical protein
MFQTKVEETIKTHFFPPENFAVGDNVEKYCRAEQATDDNMAQTHCMLDT